MNLTDWKFWIVAAVVVILIIFVLSCFSSWRYGSKPRYDSDSECEDEPKRKSKKRPKKNRRKPRVDPEDILEGLKVSMKPSDPRIFKTPKPIPVSELGHHQDSLLSSRDAIPSLEVVSTAPPPPPMKEIDLTPSIPSFLTTSRPNNNDGGRPQSKGEAAARAAMEKVYGVPFNKDKPAWLVNPKTGRRLELDGVNHDLRMAFEYHGEQHYVFKSYFYSSYDEFVAQVERDNIKVNLCDANGYYLITIPYNIPQESMVDYIRYNDPSAVALRRAREAEIYGH